MNRIAQQINKLKFSRELNNYLNNIQINNSIKKQLTKLLAANNLYANIENEFIQILKNKYINEFILKYSQYKNIFNNNDKYILQIINNFFNRLAKKYLNEYAQQEIQNNLKYPINSQINNLSFSSQDPYLREAPVIICREFLKNNQYKDHILIGNLGEHHDHILNQNIELLNHCKLNEKDFYTCAYLYSPNIIYLSTNEYNAYSSLDEVANIIHQQYPQMNIFSVTYSKIDKTKKITKRLARKNDFSTMV